MSTAHRPADTGDRPVASDRRVDRAGPMENAGDALQPRPRRRNAFSTERRASPAAAWTHATTTTSAKRVFHRPLDGQHRRPHAPHAYSL